MLPTFVIGLREGVEAALIVRHHRRVPDPEERAPGDEVDVDRGRCRHRDLRRHRRRPQHGWRKASPSRNGRSWRECLALIAVAGVTYMVVWMRRHARELKGHLERHAADALVAGSTLALVGMAFFAVIREGMETAIFMLAAFQNSTNPTATGLRGNPGRDRCRRPGLRDLSGRHQDQLEPLLPGDRVHPGAGSSRLACQRCAIPSQKLAW